VGSARTLVKENVYDAPFLTKRVIQPEGLGSKGISQLRKTAALAEMHYK
jgi:hypothetical protein